MSARVVAVAGRRVDAPGGSPARFPVDHVGAVRDRLRDRLSARAREGARALVASAACGADLLALEEAQRLGLRLRVVLPFEPARFRIESVVDRPGDWGPLFDRLVAEVRARGDLVVLATGADGQAAFLAVNEAVLQEALTLARDENGQAWPDLVVALTVWDGVARGPDDVTAAFRARALELGHRVEDILT